MNTADIAKLTGVDYITAWRWKKRLNFPSGRNLDRLLELRDTGIISADDYRQYTSAPPPIPIVAQLIDRVQIAKPSIT